MGKGTGRACFAAFIMILGLPVMAATAAAQSAPEANRFIKDDIVKGLNEPVSFGFLPDGDVLITERHGRLLHVQPSTGQMEAIATLDVVSKHEFGLVAVAADPAFERNRFVYLMYNAKAAEGVVQRVSRFTWGEGSLDLTTEKILLSFHMDDTCCHTGGGLRFDGEGLLYIATGDNTNPFESDGYGPMDGREGRAVFDARRSSGNTNDLRGKILRIRPEADGTYSIPSGNLFGEGETGRPEIYVMGTRNAYTLAVDKPTGEIFYGDIGPDAREDKRSRGPLGYDEVNRVRAAGNFGWPFVVGPNRPYRMYNFATRRSGDLVNLEGPENNSPHNTGARILPPAQPPLLAYPYAPSQDYPELGAGGRNALVGGVYRLVDRPGEGADHPYPVYYDGALFIGDFIRGWIKSVRFEAETNKVTSIEPFAGNLEFYGLLDMGLGPDGSLYTLEYGRDWFAPNPEAGLARIRYVGPDNRPPKAAMGLSALYGAAPLTVSVSGERSTDPDGDTLSYAWQVARVSAEDEAPVYRDVGTGQTTDITLAEPGRYAIRLIVRDPSDLASETEAVVDVGNTPPTVRFAIEGNRSFFWEDARTLDYRVDVVDAEDGTSRDGTIEPSLIRMDLTYRDNAQGHRSNQSARGADLVEENGCLACHQVGEASIGPSYRAIASRYAQRSDAQEYLMGKIRTGGAGAWGDMPMPSYAHLEADEIAAIIAYIRSTGSSEATLPGRGSVVLSEHVGQARTLQTYGNRIDGAYRLKGIYTDQGAQGAPPITGTVEHDLIPARMFLAEQWEGKELPGGIVGRLMGDMRILRVLDDDNEDKPDATRQFIPLGRFDLRQIRSLRVGSIPMETAGPWAVSLHAGGRNGPVLGSVTINVEEEALTVYRQDSMVLEPRTGFQDLYLSAGMTTGRGRLHLVDVTFEKGE